MTDGGYLKVTPRQLFSYIDDVIHAGLVPFVRSSPGIGKSSIMKNVAKKNNLLIRDHRLSTAAPEDLSGLPHFTKEGFAEFAPFHDLFPLSGSQVPEGYNGWMLFLDEFNSASKSVQAAAYKLILDKMVGQHHLHKRCVLTAAGNLDTDRALTTDLSTAMQSRVIHFELQLSFQEWFEDVALKEGYDKRIIAFLSENPSRLMDFRPTHHDRTFCCPRTWEFVNKLLQNENPDAIDPDDTALYAGAITSGIAIEFVAFTRLYSNMITVKEILANPETANIPEDKSTLWAITSNLLEKVDAENLEKISIYINRFNLPFKVLFYRSIHVVKPELGKHPASIKAMVELNKNLS